MGPKVLIESVTAIHGGTLFEIDFSIEGKKGRMFLPLRDMLKALHNHLYDMEEMRLLDQGFEKTDPDLPNQNLIV